MDKEKNKENGKSRPYNHLKWPAIVIAFLIVLLVVVMDYCSRTGKI